MIVRPGVAQQHSGQIAQIVSRHLSAYQRDRTGETNISGWWADPQLDRAQYAAAALFGRYAKIRERVQELKNSFLTAAEISELADIATELVELVDLNEELRGIGERIVAADKAPRPLDHKIEPLLPIQCKMARRVLGWGVRSLADEAGVSPATVARFERGEALQENTIEALQHALEAGGVEFTNGEEPGVRVRKGVSKEGRKIREI